MTGTSRWPMAVRSRRLTTTSPTSPRSSLPSHPARPVSPKPTRTRMSTAKTRDTDQPSASVLDAGLRPGRADRLCMGAVYGAPARPRRRASSR